MADENAEYRPTQQSGGRIYAPWTDQQVAALIEWQNRHRFICPREHGEESVLKVWANGWFCNVQDCDYTQDWAWAFMAEAARGE